MKGFALCLLLAAAGGQEANWTEFNFSFLRCQFDDDHLRLLGSGDAKAWDFIHREVEGLRMALPAGSDVEMVGVASRFPVCGDFEITARYTILKCDPTAQGSGTGPGIYIKTLSTGENTAVLARLNRPTEGEVYNAYFATQRRDGTRQHQPVFTETNSLSGSLRLVRSGETLEYFVAEGESRDFRLIRDVRLGSEDIAVVRVGVDHGGSDAAIEVLWEELTIGMRPPVGRNVPWGLVLVALLLVTVALLLFFYRRRICNVLQLEATNGSPTGGGGVAS
jgi:hypothetical protein